MKTVLNFSLRLSNFKKNIKASLKFEFTHDFWKFYRFSIQPEEKEVPIKKPAISIEARFSKPNVPIYFFLKSR